MRKRQKGIALVTLLMLGAILATSALTLAVDYTRQNNVARQMESTYQDQQAIQGGIQWGMAYVITHEGEAPAGNSGTLVIAGRTVTVKFTGSPTAGWQLEANL